MHHRMGFQESLMPLLQTSNDVHKSENSRFDIRNRAVGQQHTNKSKPQNEAQLGLGRVMLAGGSVYRSLLS